MATVDDGVTQQGMLGYQDEQGNQVWGLVSQNKNSTSQKFGLLQRKITPAEILTLGANPIEILPAPAPNEMYVVIYWTCYLKWNSVAYNTEGDMAVYYGDLVNSIGAVPSQVFLLEQTQNAVDFGPGELENSQQEGDAVLGQPLILANTSSQEWLDGDSDVYLTIYYAIVEVLPPNA